MKLTGPAKDPDQRGFVSGMMLALQGEEVTLSTEAADRAQLCLCLQGVKG